MFLQHGPPVTTLPANLWIMPNGICHRNIPPDKPTYQYYLGPKALPIVRCYHLGANFRTAPRASDEPSLSATRLQKITHLRFCLAPSWRQRIHATHRYDKGAIVSESRKRKRNSAGIRALPPSRPKAGVTITSGFQQEIRQNVCCRVGETFAKPAVLRMVVPRNTV